MQDVAAMIDTNIKGVIAMTKAIVPHMVAGKAGHVINMSSIAAHESYSGGAVYCATKHAVSAFTGALRHDLIATPVRPSVRHSQHQRTCMACVACGTCASRGPKYSGGGRQL